MKLRCKEPFVTIQPANGYRPGNTYDIPDVERARLWVDQGLMELVEQDPHELAAFKGGAPKKRGPGRPRKNPIPA